jgi:hypothetical protein
METQLSVREQETLLELGRRGSGGNFDQLAMSKLFAMGMVEVRSDDRRLALTAVGRNIYAQLVGPRPEPQRRQ